MFGKFGGGIVAKPLKCGLILALIQTFWPINDGSLITENCKQWSRRLAAD
jgi:hypothetical protein